MPNAESIMAERYAKRIAELEAELAAVKSQSACEGNEPCPKCCHALVWGEVDDNLICENCGLTLPSARAQNMERAALKGEVETQYAIVRNLEQHLANAVPFEEHEREVGAAYAEGWQDHMSQVSCGIHTTLAISWIHSDAFTRLEGRRNALAGQGQQGQGGE